MVVGVGLTAAFIGIVGSNVFTEVQRLDQKDEDASQSKDIIG